MNVQISIRHMAVSHGPRQLVHEMCDEVQYRCHGKQNIDVKIEDVNSPYRTGIDKYCYLRVWEKQRLVIVIDDLDGDPGYSMDQAFCHMNKALSGDLCE